ncbi:MAG: succinate dehydrogenase, cytochrome b556 subunit [Alphaproteobacteria bacterium]|nr:succinate dehydrogenase, cytochrome b556 subunit [Alphaproteobacteria bacterium]
MNHTSNKKIRPLAPNIQIYRPQLTSVLSIAHRISGIALSIFAVFLVIWLISAASGPEGYTWFQNIISSWFGQILLLGGTFAFFLHLCGGIRHLIWDSVRGFELRQIYLSGWIVVGASLALTLSAWFASLLIVGLE